MQITKREKDYLDQLAADIARHGDLENMSFDEAIRAAHERRQRFAAEMHEGSTERSRMARRAIATNAWVRVQSSSAASRLMSDCEFVRSGDL